MWVEPDDILSISFMHKIFKSSLGSNNQESITSTNTI